MACESCRSLKVRCRPAPEGTANSCVRCAASGQECKYPEPRRTKRKRTDVRVGELEQQVAALGELLRAAQTSGHPRGPAQEATMPTIPIHHASPARLVARAAALLPISYDPIGSGLVSIEGAASLFQRYVSDLVPQRPLVVFPPGTSAEAVRIASPLLFLAVLAASASTLHGDLGAALSDLVHKAYGEKIMMRGEKSLEPIQAILITTNWYYPPDTYDSLNFYQLIHMAATMALDIGLGEPTRSASEALHEEPSHCAALVRERTLLACYLCCSRQHMFPFTRYMDECLEALETSQHRAATDTVLAAWVRLQKIVDLSAAALCLRDRAAEVDLSDPGTQLSLQNCSKQLERWKRSLGDGLMTGSLLIQFNALLCLVHESGLHIENDPSDFKSPYAIGTTLNTDAHSRAGRVLTPAHLSSIMACVSSAHELFETFISMPATALRCSPVAAYARLVYAVVVLVKVSVSTIMKRGLLYGVVRPEAVRAETYLERVLRKLTETSVGGCKIAEKWVVVVGAVLAWFKDHLNDASANEGSTIEPETIVPLKYLDAHADDASRNRSRTTNSPVDEPRPNEKAVATESPPAAGRDSTPGEWFPQLNLFLDYSDPSSLLDLGAAGVDALVGLSDDLDAANGEAFEATDWAG